MCRTRKTMSGHKSILNSVRKSPARRNLFGSVDHEQLKQEYQDTLSRDLKVACQRWGFDFRSDKPLAEGDFQWEMVPKSDVPLVYCPDVVGQGEEAQRVGGQEDSAEMVWVGRPCDRENIYCTPDKYRVSPHNLEKTLDKEENVNENCLKRKQTNLTDFYQAQKRVVGMPRKSGQ
ncbi:hypothetical protein DPEC_G00211960 [Dallia pectoralis]|uniref:Uncharacterized protein n=1 Tax=Dallia pectoralis TaxID=75939 RepID=A0ACC2G6G2_DALPE|nr:hypothetical protein DPEC_G00211960 [Dallia pectoralis]